MSQLVNDQIEEILERLPASSLVRFKRVSKEWKLTIESRRFKEKHMIRRQQQTSEHEFLLIRRNDDKAAKAKNMTMSQFLVNEDQEAEDTPNIAFHQSFGDTSNSCDGLVCIYDLEGHIHVINPITMWLKDIPQPGIREHVFKWFGAYIPSLLGFGKDICTKSYKLVWLYNSIELGLAPTTCEVFDFSMDNTWRLVESPQDCRVINQQPPIYLDGLLHWLVFMNGTEIKILSFDCHTESFQVIPSDPQITQKNDLHVVMCTLNGRLCVSEKWWPRQDIKILNPSSMTWEKIYTLDISLYDDAMRKITYCPLTVLKNQKLLLFDEFDEDSKLVIYDLETKSYYQSYPHFQDVLQAIPFSQSLISID